MRKSVITGILAAAMGLGIMAPASAAPAVPSAPAVESQNDQMRVDVRHRHRDWRRGDWRRDDRRWHRRHYRPRSGFSFGIIVAPRPVYRHYRHAPRIHLGRSHVNWCYNRYRSYRASDNTFQPYHGPRRTCWSPYN